MKVISTGEGYYEQVVDRGCMRKICKHKSHVFHVILVRSLSRRNMQPEAETIILTYRNTVTKFRGNPSVNQVSKADLPDHDH